jgi:hypothetical protein
MEFRIRGEIGRGRGRRGRPVVNVEMIKQMRNLQAQLEAMEASQQRGIDIG